MLPLFLIVFQNVLTMIEKLAAFFDLALRSLDQSHNGLRRYRFSTAGLPYDRQCLSFLQSKVNPSYRLDLTGICMIRNSEVFHFQNRFLLVHSTYLLRILHLSLFTGEVSGPVHLSVHHREG